MILISVVVTTYNWPSALKLCLESLFAQTDKNFEIIIADDGSNSENLKLTRSFCADSPVSICYVHHDDQGFRAGTIRNKAVAQSKGDYLVFIDGDCVLRSDFIYVHRQLAAVGCFVPGNRVLLSQSFTQKVIEEHIPLYAKSVYYFLLLWLQKKINRLLGVFKLPLGLLRYSQPKKWKKAMTCNLGVWKKDFIRVNGFDELFEGWGFEDSDLVIRLIHCGIHRKEGRFAVPVFHLWHPHNDRSRQGTNYKRLLERLHQDDFVQAKKGVLQYL